MRKYQSETHILCAIAGAELPQTVPPADPSLLPKIEAAQFQPYLQACSSRMAKYEAARSRQLKDRKAEEESSFTPGDGLAEALCVVPAMFFKEDFSLARWDSIVYLDLTSV